MKPSLRFPTRFPVASVAALGLIAASCNEPPTADTVIHESAKSDDSTKARPGRGAIPADAAPAESRRLAMDPAGAMNRPAPGEKPSSMRRLAKTKNGNQGFGLAHTPSAEPNREAYDDVRETAFRSPLSTPLSTFSIDVDTASYSNVRRLLNERKPPPRGAVRIEEMLNYFRFDYPQPAGGAPFATHVQAGPCPWNSNHRLVHIGLQGRLEKNGSTPARNLVFLLDVSGSMRSANKLPLLKQAFEILVNQLNEEDSVAIVVYAGASGLVLPSTHGDDKQRIREAMANLRAGGSTNGGAGIRLAYKIARKNFRKDAINRVILATDGDFNVGTSSRSELVSLIEKQRESGVFLTVLGLGTGNLQDATMEQLANKGNGNYAYLDTVAEARKVLGEQVGSTLSTIAKDVKLQVEFNPAKVKGYRLIGYENRRLAAEDFANDKVDAGEIGAGHTVTALYEVIPVGAPTEMPKRPELSYQATDLKPAAALGDDLLTLKVRYKEPQGRTSQLLTQSVTDPGAGARTTTEFDFAASVAMFGMLLRGSEFAGTSSFRLAHELAAGALTHDPGGYRKQFLGLIQAAQELQAEATSGK